MEILQFLCSRHYCLVNTLQSASANKAAVGVPTASPSVCNIAVQIENNFVPLLFVVCVLFHFGYFINT
jgi:hypothetical protein